MADFAGQLISGPGRLSPAAESTDVTGGVASVTLLAGTGLRPLAGPGGAQPAVTIAHTAGAGVMVETFGGLLFERIIVLPRVKALQFVLTATQFPVEVWNSSLKIDQVLSSITITGAGGISIADPLGEPLLYAAQDSRIYQATLPGAGAPAIAEDVVFAFVSGILGADMEVTGSRITVFSPAPEWSEGMEETFDYLTDVLHSYSDAEQRRGLRQLPRRALRFRALTLKARFASGMESLLWGWQNQPYAVPWWPDAQPLLSSVIAGAFTIPVDTADRQFAAGGLAAIWTDEFTFEALQILSVSALSLTLSEPTQFAWTAGATVIPLLLCRLPAAADVARISSDIAQIDVSFVGESGQLAPAPSISPTQYKGFDVLEIPPNWDSAPLKRAYKRSMVTIDPKVGPIEVVDKGGSAIVGQEFPWWLDTHPTVTAFRAFMLRRFGQLKPFWLPTWNQDLILKTDVGSGDASIVISSVFYSRFAFPSPARKCIAFIDVVNGNVYRKVTAAVDNGDGTETLTLDSPTGRGFSAAGTMVSFLTFARLASDSVAIQWSSSDHADALMEFQEVPREVPA